MEKPPRLGRSALKVLQILLEDPTRPFAGSELLDRVGVTGGALYPVLYRLEDLGILRSKWEDGDPSNLRRPRRRLYALTAKGARIGEELLTDLSCAVQVLQRA